MYKLKKSSMKWPTIIGTKLFVVSNEGGLNQRRPLIFQGNQPFIGTAGDQNIGKTVPVAFNDK